MRGGGMEADDLQDAVEILRAEPRRNILAEDGLRAVVVLLGMKLHAALVELADRADGPPGEASRDFHHVALRVAAVDAERVQFQQFARVVFVRLVGVLSACD